MIDPFIILAVPPDATDEAIRHAYLEQVRRYPAERDAERFQRIRAAYEQIKTRRERMSYYLFCTDAPTAESLLEHLDNLATPARPKREQFQALLRMNRYEIE